MDRTGSAAGASSETARDHRGGAINYEAGYTKPVFHWTFDGGARNNYRHREFFADLGVTPTLAISPARLADEDRMSWDQLRELQDECGWGVANHGHRHERFDELTPADQEAEVVDAIEAFRARGVEHRHYVYSWGMAGGQTGRSIVANYYPYAWGTVHAPETAGIVDVESPYALPRTFVERESREAIEAAIDRAIEAGTGMVLFGHNVVDGESVDPDGFETDVERIEHLTEYVRERGGEWVDSLDAVVRYAKTPVRLSGGSEPVRIDDVVAETARVDDLSADSARVDDLAAGTVHADRVARREVGAAACQSTDQSIPSGERTQVALDGTRFDHRGEFDPESGAIVVSRPGTYSLRGAVHLRTPGPGAIRLCLLCDGRAEAVSTGVAGEAGTHSRAVEAHLELDEGETVALAVDHGTGGTAHTVAGEGRVRLELVRLG